MSEKVAIKETVAAMTKSKKKRLKRLKAKQLRQEDEELKNKFLPNDSSALNPIDKMRKELVNVGYDIHTVDVALEKMWNLQMDYSNFDSVLNFLTLPANSQQERNDHEKTPVDSKATSRTVSPAQVSFDSNEGIIRLSSFEFSDSPKADSSLVDTAPLSFSTGGKSESEEAEDDVAPSVQDNHLVNPQYLTSNVRGLDNFKTPVRDENVKSFVADSSCEPTLPAKTTACTANNDVAPANDPLWKQPMKQKDRKKTIRIKPFDLTAKLEIVANNEKLTDGIIALTEWVVKAASPMEIQQLCAQSSSSNNALATVVRRSVQQQGTSVNSTTGQLLDLIGSILRAVGVSSNQVVSTAKALGSFLKEASHAMDAASSHEGDKIRSLIADSVASTVTRTIAKLVNHYVGNLDSKDAMMQRLEKEIEQLQSSALTVGRNNKSNDAASIVDLMSARDKTKLVLDKYSRLFTLALDSNDLQRRYYKSDDVDLTETEIMKDILGDEYQSIIESKKKLEEMKANEGKKCSGISEMEKILHDVNVLSSEKEHICTRMQELRRELDELVIKEKHIDVKLQDSEAKLKTLEGTLSNEVKELNEKMNALNQKAKIDDSISGFAKKVCEFAKVMDTVHIGETAGCAGMTSGDTDQSILNEFSLFLTASSRYFSSELKTVLFLKNRGVGAQKELPRLQREIKEFESLGMTTTVAEMKKKEKDMLDNLLEDSELVESLTGEADATKTDFINQLELFLSSVRLADLENTSQIELLREIDTCLTQLGINEDTKWKKIMTQVNKLTGRSPKTLPVVSAEVKTTRMAWKV